MNVIYKEKRSGKTNELIKLSEETGYTIVCSNLKEALINSKKGIIPFPITFDDFINKNYYGKGIKGFLIDDVDHLLRYLTDYIIPIGCITITKEETSC